MARINMVQAINLALRQEMEQDKDVVLIGEDVGKDGGVFRITAGLIEKFPDRIKAGCRDTIHGIYLCHY